MIEPDPDSHRLLVSGLPFLLSFKIIRSFQDTMVSIVGVNLALCLFFIQLETVTSSKNKEEKE